MRTKIVKDGWPLIMGSIALFVFLAVGSHVFGWAGAVRAFIAAGLAAAGFFLFFFRDPERQPPADPAVFVAGADGLIRAVEVLREEKHLKAEAARVSIFLSPFDVHVNRAPMGGKVTHLSYTPGRHLLTIDNASSEHNEHSSILIEGEGTRCLVKQIVGPIVRRVVYWLDLNQGLARGDRIGMMKFGSRLDMYFPKGDVEVLVRKGDRVRGGETPVARRT